jgi:hypothetical protein
MAVKLQGWLLAQERELDSRGGALMAWEDGLMASKCTLGRARMECDAECDRAEAVRQDYRVRICAFTAGYRRSFYFDRALDGR